ncbi:MAG: hypothetical protein K2H09_03260 [Treponemataceae bacterium]|nr:hypothetical protein [Treponemataceae bacterium]
MEEAEELLHWSDQQEVVSSNSPILFLFRLLVVLPAWLVSFFVLPVGFFYMVSSRPARNEARLYQKQLRAYFGRGVPKRISPFLQVLSFSLCIVEKIEGWMGKVPFDKIIKHDDDVGALISQLEAGRGAVVIGSHLGNIELLRSLSSYDETGVGRNVPVTAIFEMKSTEQFNKTLCAINPKAGFNVIDPGDIGIETISVLQEQVERGGLVVFAADRTSARARQRCIREEFLGRLADFPYGVFLLAALLNAPTYFMFGLRTKIWSLFPKYHIFIEKSQVDFHCPRSEREERILSLCREFVGKLEKYCRQFPYQWYNFFNFWLTSDGAQ